MRKILAATIFLATSLYCYAQSGTNSPYSQYGLGTLSQQSGSQNRGMNGLAYGFHERNQINFKNPASYSAIDSLSFLFDVGLSLQMTSFEEQKHRKNARNANFEYIMAGFRAFKHVGISFGLVPFSNVGFNYKNNFNVNAFSNQSEVNPTYSNTYYGNGGLRQVYLGVGWEPIKGVAFGLNGSYLWGELNRTITNTYSDGYVNTLSKQYTHEVRSYTLTGGLQVTRKVSKKDALTLGFVYTYGHKVSGSARADIISRNPQTNVADTTQFSIGKGMKLPHVYGVGFMWNHSNRLKLGLDYQLEKWGNIGFPVFSIANNVASYRLEEGQVKDRHKYVAGFDYCKGERYRGFFSRIHYRGGVGYATPYININGKEGPKELSASIGLGIPISNAYNNRSFLNISGEWVNLKANGLINENMFRINIGLTFNERWFAKFKVD